MTPGRRAPARRPRLPWTVGGPLGLGGLLLATAVLPALAQEGGLPQLTLDVSPRIEAGIGNTEDEDDGLSAVTGLAFSFLDATPTQTLSLSADGSVGADGDGSTFTGPALSFGYDRSVPSAGLALDATLRRDAVEDLADLSDFVDDDGVIVLPPDFDLLSGSGTRREVTASAALSLRDDRPLGFGLSAAVTDIAYEDAESPDLVDSRRVTLGASARATLEAGREVTAALSWSALDEDGAERSETWGLDLTASADRPRGPISATLSLDDTEDGPRVEARLGRTLAFPTGSLAGSLGVARGAEGDIAPTASLTFSREAPSGGVRLSLTQAFREGDDDEEELATTVAAGLDRTLSPRANLSLDALFAATEPTAGEAEATRALELGASLGYALTSDWSVDAGVRGRWSDDGAEEERGATVFLGLSRRFQGTF